LSNLGLKVELRDGETIRAYLDELVRLKSPIQFWQSQSDDPPFETTLQQVMAQTFSTVTTPKLEVGQILNFSFMLEARRFTSFTKVVATGVFTIPSSIAQGERRDRLRAVFERSDAAEAFLVETVAGTLCAGRTILGKVLDLSLQGVRVALDDTGWLSGPNPPLQRGDVFQAVRISHLPMTPTIACGAILDHVTPVPGGLSAGFLLTGLADLDQKNITRILARRFPATFGQAFPAKKRKTDIADKAGALTKTKVTARPAEVVERPVEKPAPAAPPARVEVTAVMRLRKLGKQILFLSGSPEAQHPLAEAFRADGYKHVVQARTFLEAQALTRRTRFDLVVLDMKVGGHWAKEMINALRSHGLLLGVPLILVADYRNEGTETVAEELAAVHVHERRESYEELAPWLYGFLLED
jgi:CheY-like chemotaxis protein